MMNTSPLSLIKQIEIASLEYPDAISLAQGTPALASDTRVRDAAIQAITSGAADAYSHVAGLQELREAICESLARDHMRYNTDEIIVTAGSMEALSSIILGTVSPGDEVIVITPTYYGAYKGIIELARATPIAVGMREEDHGWQINVDDIKARISERTAAIIVCSPNNPTGTILSKDELYALGELAHTHNFLLIFDDVYARLVYDDAEVFSLAREARFRDNIVRIVSFSKDCAMTGWRAGYVHASKELIGRIIAVHNNLINCAPVATQYAMLGALRYNDDIVQQNIAEYGARRDVMARELSALRQFLSFSTPRGAYYFFPRVIGVDDTIALAFDILKRAHIAVVPGEEFGHGGAGHIRLCFGRSREDIIEGIKRLKIYFESFRT